MRELELKAELDLERQLREWERKKLACQPVPQAKVTPTPKLASCTLLLLLLISLCTCSQLMLMFLVSSPAYQPVEAEAVAAYTVVSYWNVGAEALPHTAAIVSLCHFS